MTSNYSILRPHYPAEGGKARQKMQPPCNRAWTNQQGCSAGPRRIPAPDVRGRVTRRANACFSTPATRQRATSRCRCRTAPAYDLSPGEAEGPYDVEFLGLVKAA